MLKLLEINYREIVNLANVVEQPFDDIISNYREKDQSRVTMLMYVRAKAREIIEMFSFARQESTTTEQIQPATTTGCDPNWTRSREDRAYVRSNYRSKRNARPRRCNSSRPWNAGEVNRTNWMYISKSCMRSRTKTFSQVKQLDLKGNEEREKHLLRDRRKLVPCFLLHWR